tara:strand:+ start:322 stop:528 length:207 start_codon:yes stop_codon:yes gene_type:complete
MNSENRDKITEAIEQAWNSQYDPKDQEDSISKEIIMEVIAEARNIQFQEETIRQPLMLKKIDEVFDKT